MDDNLYRLLKVNSPNASKDVIKDRYKWENEDFNDRDQIEELQRKQPLIRPRVPEGIITIKSDDSKINGISPGIIIPYFKGYKDFSHVSKSDYKKLLILLRKVFDDIRNLADNEIAQEDLFRSKIKNGVEECGYNIVQKNDDAQLIDMSGQFVTVGNDFHGPNLMYEDFAKMMNYYYRANGLEPIYDNEENLTEDDLSRMITEFEKQTKNK